MLIAPLGPIDSRGLCRFKSEVMAELRSIEQQYWALACQREQLQAREKTVEMVEEILKRVQEEVPQGRGGGVADIAEAAQRLEQFQLDLVAKTSDVITTERQLRNLLRLPPADDRMIVPSSPPILAKLEPSWEESLATMRKSQPDVVYGRLLLDKAEEAFDLAHGLGDFSLCAPCAISDGSTDDNLLRKQEFHRQVLHQSTHSLARFFLEIDANYKQYMKAANFTVAARNRLEGQRAFYDEGRITIDRFLDAISQYTNALAQESQFKSSYNISIIALEEAKGTLIEFDKILVVKDGRDLSIPYDKLPWFPELAGYTSSR
jgi:outer membrane protein TolC